jgi:hypothetical protein
MNALLAQPILAAVIFTACVLLAAATAMVLYRRDKKAASSNEPSRRAEARTTKSHAAAMSQSVTVLPALLPEYPARLEQRNRAVLAARTLRRPGVAARWKSQNRVATGI